MMKVTMKARGKNHFKIKKKKYTINSNSDKRKQSIITANGQDNPRTQKAILIRA